MKWLDQWIPGVQFKGRQQVGSQQRRTKWIRQGDQSHEIRLKPEPKLGGTAEKLAQTRVTGQVYWAGWWDKVTVTIHIFASDFNLVFFDMNFALASDGHLPEFVTVCPYSNAWIHKGGGSGNWEGCEHSEVQQRLAPVSPGTFFVIHNTKHVKCIRKLHPCLQYLTNLAITVPMN